MNTTNSYSLESFIKKLHWLQFIVQWIYTLGRWTLPLVMVKNHWPGEKYLCFAVSTITFTLSS